MCSAIPTPPLTQRAQLWTCYALKWRELSRCEYKHLTHHLTTKQTQEFRYSDAPEKAPERRARAHATADEGHPQARPPPAPPRRRPPPPYRRGVDGEPSPLSSPRAPEHAPLALPVGSSEWQTDWLNETTRSPFHAPPPAQRPRDRPPPLPTGRTDRGDGGERGRDRERLGG